MVGKLPPELLEELVVGRSGAADDRVLQGPAYGEDTAAIELDEGTLVVNADPISLAAERIGTLGVNVACNDVAASGGTPEWLTSVVFLPDPETAEGDLDAITRQLDAAARDLDASIVGGHTEYAPALSDPILVVTCFGFADRYVPTSGARPGDTLLVTKGAGIEGTAILATDFRDAIEGDVDAELIERGAACYDDVGVLEEAAVVSPHASAMHDPTEGGLVNGLFELAAASGVRLEVSPASIPVRPETRALCDAVGVDPLRIFGSGALLAALPADTVDRVSEELAARGVEHARIGTVHAADEPAVDLGTERLTEPIRDGMYALWE
jgi:hydrogenase expression/formation protein HypE